MFAAKSNWDDRRAWNAMMGLTVADDDYRFAYDHDIDITDQNAFTLYYDANAPCRADCGGSGGSSTLDIATDNNDEIVFINEYFNHDPSADIGVAGGYPGSDGLFDNNDFIAFYNWFYGACN